MSQLVEWMDGKKDQINADLWMIRSININPLSKNKKKKENPKEAPSASARATEKRNGGKGGVFAS